MAKYTPRDYILFIDNRLTSILNDCMRTVDYKNGAYKTHVTKTKPFANADRFFDKTNLFTAQDVTELINPMRVGITMLEKLMNQELNNKMLAEAWQDNVEIVVFKYFKNLTRDRSEEKALENFQVTYRGRPEGFERHRRATEVQVDVAEGDTLDENEIECLRLR